MNTRKNNCYIITGGPGAGKTTLLRALRKRGYKTIPEDARKIIKQQILSNGKGLPWGNKVLYAKLMLEASLESFKIGHDENAITFFDRGILDTICYMRIIKLGVTSEIEQIPTTHLYNKKVFILPPWLAIYETDEERKQSWQEAFETYEKIKKTYCDYGYEVIDVPIGTVEERVHFMLKNIDPTNKIN
ncbi:AAA family ATPase [Sphingobacterium sp. SG20118]|uniref:AAA family ATPase n=1 Tax=Sphingobacterium TaxID=28453 RepID=UPI002468A1C3|nr:AAA family ATPase [Sphingobacterium faecium]MDH5827154.1 AAA family ATPase [Sphingobacterium faecium]